MTRRAALLLAAIIAVVAAAAVFVAAGTAPLSIGGRVEAKSVEDLPIVRRGPQPSLAIASGFLNTKPLKDADLKNKVVVYDFWTYSCVNCVRTIPYLESWFERYEKDGLVLVGVHSPEFEFEKDHANVRDAVRKLGVRYPVALDDDMDIWNAFSNQYWPAKYVTDRSGNVRYAHFGEGAYEQTENVLRLLLGVAKDAPRAQDPNREEADATRAPTPETYLGEERGGDPWVKLRGRFTRADEYVESQDAHENLDLTYHGGEVNLVMGRSRKNPTYAVIELDGKPVPEKYRGTALEVLDGQTVVRVDESDLYNLITNGPKGNHVLRVHPVGAGVRLYAFTFGA